MNETEFWAKVRKTRTCWVWGGASSNGYGMAVYAGRAQMAHRIAYMFVRGGIGEGLQLDHRCRNRACVNPAHLEAVTRKENILRGNGAWALNRRKTHCVRGHKFDVANTYTDARGSRICRTCKAAWARNKRRTPENVKA